MASAGSGVAGPVVTDISPSVLDIGPAAEFQVEGTGLENVTRADLYHPQHGSYEAAIDLRQPDQLGAQVNIAAADVGDYIVRLYNAEDEETVAGYVEVTQPPSIVLPGTENSPAMFPIGGFQEYANTQLLLHQSDLGRPFHVATIRFQTTADCPAFTGEYVVRFRETDASVYTDNMLSATGWYGVPSYRTVSTAGGGEPLVLPLNDLYAYSGNGNLEICILWKIGEDLAGNYLEGWETGEIRLKAGISDVLYDPIHQWEGDYPPVRFSSSRLPAMELILEEAPVRADFSLQVSQATTGRAVPFTDLSEGPIDVWEWDFDGDGTVDSTDSSPSWTYSSEGTYTVILTVRNGQSADAETRRDWLTVVAGEPDPREQWRVF